MLNFSQSHESVVFVSISRLTTNLLKLNIVLLIGYTIFITNNRRFFIFKLIRNRRFNCIISKYADEIDILIDEWSIDKVPNMIHFPVNVWSKRMLSVTSSKNSCLIELGIQKSLLIIKIKCSFEKLLNYKHY